MARPEKPIPPDAPAEVAHLATRLRELRKESKLTYAQLSARCHYSQAALSVAASGKTTPKWETLQAYVYGCGYTGELSDWRRLWRKACQADGVADLSANEDTGETPIPPVVHRPTIVMTPAGVPSTSDRTFWTTTKTAFGPTAAVDNGAPGITVDTTVPGTTTVKTGGEMPPPPTGGGEGMAALLRLFVEHYSRDRDVMQRVTDPTTADAMYTALSLCTTPEDVMQEMRDLCADRGLNWDALEDRSRQVYPISAETFAQVLSGNELPTTEWLHIFLRACGIPEERTPIWHHTVARIKIAQLRHRRPPVQLAVEQPAEPAQQTITRRQFTIWSWLLLTAAAVATSAFAVSAATYMR